MARLTISLPDKVLDELKNTKPWHLPMSQHIVGLLVNALEIKSDGDQAVESVAVD